MYMITPGNVGENINSHEAFKEEKRMEKKQGFLKKFLAVMIAVFSLTLLSPEVATQLGTMQTVQAAVKINSKKITLTKGQKKTLKLKGTKKKAKWSSSKKSVATVSSKGVVFGKKKGTTVITAKIGSKKYTCKVTVETPKLNKKSVTLSVGKSSTLKVTGTKQKVKWTSSNTAIATITRNGKVVAKSAGTAEVIANVGGAKFVCKVNVKGSQKPAPKPTTIPAPVTRPITGIKLSSNSIELEVKKTYTLQATIIPENTTDNKMIVWSSSNSNVATVTNGVVTAHAVGNADIQARTSNGIVSTCKVIVKEGLTEKDKMAGYFLKYLTQILKDPDSLNVYGIYDGYNEGVNSSTGSSYHNEFIIVDWSATNSYGGRVRCYTHLFLDSEYSSISDYNIQYGNQNLRGFDNKSYPDDFIITRSELNKDKILEYSKTLTRIQTFAK